MARRRKLTKAQKRQQRRVKQQKEARDVVSDTAATFTCSADIADDFRFQCESRREELDCDLAFNRVALEIWRGRPGRARDLADALAAFASERERHLAVLTELSQRFADLVADKEFHEHLDPVEDYRALVRDRIFPEETAPQPTPTPVGPQPSDQPSALSASKVDSDPAPALHRDPDPGACGDCGSHPPR